MDEQGFKLKWGFLSKNRGEAPQIEVAGFVEEPIKREPPKTQRHRHGETHTHTRVQAHAPMCALGWEGMQLSFGHTLARTRLKRTQLHALAEVHWELIPNHCLDLVEMFAPPAVPFFLLVW